MRANERAREIALVMARERMVRGAYMTGDEEADRQRHRIGTEIIKDLRSTGVSLSVARSALANALRRLRGEE